MDDIRKNITTRQEENISQDDSLPITGNESSSSTNSNESNTSNSGETGEFNGMAGTNSSTYVNRSDVQINSSGNVTNPRLSYFKPNMQEMKPSEIRDFIEDLTRLNGEMEDIPPSFYESYAAIATKDLEKAGRTIYWSNNSDQMKNFPDGHCDKPGTVGSCYFRLGSFVSVIPPEFIQITSSTPSSQISAMRSTGPTHTKSGYVNRTITVQLFMSTIEGINGQEIESAFGYPHYINGFRHLLGMFKWTPFVPVVNQFLNSDLGIFNVGLHNIQAETVEGFPNTLQVTLTLKEFLAAPYIGMPEKWYEDAIIWPLFDFYIQRNIRDSVVGLKKIENGHFNSKLTLSILNSAVLEASNNDEMDSIGNSNASNIIIDSVANSTTGSSINSTTSSTISEQEEQKVYAKTDEYGEISVDILDKRNYVEKVNIDNKNACVTSIVIAAGNTMPSIQMSGHDSPTFQYMGGTSTEFRITIETSNSSIITEIDSMIKENIRLVRSFAYKTGIGFIRIENELFGLYGIEHILINDIVVNTVPGFPELRQIELTGVGYDAGQKDREKFKSFRPFYDKSNKKGEGWFEGRLGTRDDLISQSKKGLANKILQDSAVEVKLMTTELYPDLRLPKYSAVDWALAKIKEFNSKHGLSNDGIPDRLPRPKGMIPGRGEQLSEYNGYVDPDFYVSYFFRASQLDPSGDSPRGSENKAENDARFNSYIKANKAKFANIVKENNTGNYESDIERVKTSIDDNDIDPISALSYDMPEKPHEIIEPTYVPGYEPNMQLRFHNGFINEGKDSDDILIDKLNKWLRLERAGGGGNFDSVSGDFQHALTGQPGDNTSLPKQVKKVTGNPFVDMLINRASVQCGYVYGAGVEGPICTEKLIQQCRSDHGSYVNVSNSRKWIGRQVWDCSSFVSFGLQLIGVPIGRLTSGQFGPNSHPKIFESISRDEAQVGDIFYNGGHVAVYCGDGVVVHARGSAYGCVMNKHNYGTGSGVRCGLTSRVKGMQKYCEDFLLANPDFYLPDENIQNNTTEESNQDVVVPPVIPPIGSTTIDSNVNGTTNGSTITDSSRQSQINRMILFEHIEKIRTTTPTETTPTETTPTETTPTETTPTDQEENQNSDVVTLGTFPNEQVTIGSYRYSPHIVNKWDNLILKNAAKYNLDPNMIKAIVMIESSGNPSLYNKICCYGLMQVYATVHNVSSTDMLDPDKNLNKGCSIWSEYGAYSYVNYDKVWWLASYNTGPGNVRKIQAGTKTMPLETQNYIKKFDVFYNILLQNGGNPGNTKRPLQNGEPIDPSWVHNSTSNGVNNETGKGYVTDVWFEKDSVNSNLTGLNTDKLKNLSAGVVHKMLKVGFNMLILANPMAGLAASAYKIASSVTDGILNTEQGNQEPRVANTKANSTTSSSISGSTTSSSISEGADTKPTLDDLGITMIDSLSDKEIDFNVKDICKSKAFSNEEDIAERMFVDLKNYNTRGRLIRAFPSYIFLIIDEHGGWIDAKKFWSNYYIYQNILSIDIHSSYDNPVATAKVSLINAHRNIRAYVPRMTVTEMVLGKNKEVDFSNNDSEYGWLDQLSYKFFGSVLFDTIKDSMIDLKNELYKEIFLREGTRVHIRLGYGSNPASYSPAFSGHIYEVADDGDVVTIAAQSDGVELVSDVLTDRTSATNKDLGLPEECGDIIAALLCNRESELMYSITRGTKFIDNTYGITHFGTYHQGNEEGWRPFSWTPASYGDVAQTIQDVGVGGLCGGVFGALAGGVVGGIPGAVGGAIAGAEIGGIATSVMVRRQKYEYDLVKNIYKATYDGKYIYDPQFLWIDGETNFRFFCYDRTPWDVMKMCEKSMPGFVCYPRPFGLEYRIFFGLPQWQCKYRYERKDSTNELFEFAKAFMQVNLATTMYDIIDNRIRVTSRGHVTNLIGIYSLGGDLASTPVVMSDFKIDRSKQKTATIDTSATQNFKGLPNILDKALEWADIYDNGKHQAIRICLSELMDSWLNTYAGELLLIGSPDIMPYNYIYIQDTYADMMGMAKVKSVTHSMNGFSGYTTTVYPGVIADNTIDTCGIPNTLASCIQVTSTIAGTYFTQKWLVDKLNDLNKLLSELDWYNYGKKWLKTNGKLLLRKAKRTTFLKEGMEFIKGLAKDFINKVPALGQLTVKVLDKVKDLTKVAGLGAKVVTVGGKIFVGATSFVLSAFLTKFITDIYDYFQYNNCIRVYPLYWKGWPMLASSSGQQTLIPEEAKEYAGREFGEYIYNEGGVPSQDPNEDAYVTGGTLDTNKKPNNSDSSTESNSTTSGTIGDNTSSGNTGGMKPPVIQTPTGGQ